MKAIGPWQFMTGTAKLFGLRINWWLDERKDIVAATYAAANYLKYLHDLFGSWPLALAAYNSGEHRVARAITNQRTTDYWQLQLPRRRCGSSRNSWRLSPSAAIRRRTGSRSLPPIRSNSTSSRSSVRPSCGRSPRRRTARSSEIKGLNPHFKKWCTPPDMVVEVKVPKGRRSAVQRAPRGDEAGTSSDPSSSTR